MRQRSQALLELAVCAPVVLVLALGAVAIVQIEDAARGLDASTQAGAAAAARAPDPTTATAAARARFASVAAAYPLEAATIQMSLGDFSRGGEVTAASTAIVAIGWAVVGMPNRVQLRSRATVKLEPWRTHRPPA